VAVRGKWRYPRGTEEFGRYLAFTDAVIAIAMTLLVLGIDISRPEPGTSSTADVYNLVGSLWPQIFAFLLSFVIIGFYWIQHHRFVATLAAIDMTMLRWNVLYLLVIVMMPLMAQIIGFYGDNPEGVTLYAGIFIALGLVDSVSYTIAVRRQLFDQQPSNAMIRFQLIARLMTPAVFALSIPIAYFVSPSAAEYSWIAIWPVSIIVTRHPPES